MLFAHVHTSQPLKQSLSLLSLVYPCDASMIWSVEQTIERILNATVKYQRLSFWFILMVVRACKRAFVHRACMLQWSAAERNDLPTRKFLLIQQLERVLNEENGRRNEKRCTENAFHCTAKTSYEIVNCVWIHAENPKCTHTHTLENSIRSGAHLFDIWARVLRSWIWLRFSVSSLIFRIFQMCYRADFSLNCH